MKTTIHKHTKLSLLKPRKTHLWNFLGFQSTPRAQIKSILTFNNFTIPIQTTLRLCPNAKISVTSVKGISLMDHSQTSNLLKIHKIKNICRPEAPGNWAKSNCTLMAVVVKKKISRLEGLWILKVFNSLIRKKGIKKWHWGWWLLEVIKTPGRLKALKETYKISSGFMNEIWRTQMRMDKAKFMMR